MNCKYIYNNGIVRITGDGVIRDDLERRFYEVDADMGGFFLAPIASQNLPEKLYGNIASKADRIINTFSNRERNTGVLLSGEKGSGKTLLAKILATRLVEKYPVIFVNKNLGVSFPKFISDLPDAVLIFDEFEKNFSNGNDDEDGSQQNTLLTILDGVFQSRKLFILTCNDMNKVNNFLINRPGRIFYNFTFESLDPQFIEEYCNDNIKDKSMISNIITQIKLMYKVNFDMLQAIVEEYNRYPGNIEDVLSVLNVGMDSHQSYNVYVRPSGSDVTIKFGYMSNVFERSVINIQFNNSYVAREERSENEARFMEEWDNIYAADYVKACQQNKEERNSFYKKKLGNHIVNSYFRDKKFIFTSKDKSDFDKNGVITVTNRLGDKMIVSPMMNSRTFGDVLYDDPDDFDCNPTGLDDTPVFNNDSCMDDEDAIDDSDENSVYSDYTKAGEAVARDRGRLDGIAYGTNGNIGAVTGMSDHD